MTFRLILALAFSLALHAGLLAPDLLRRLLPVPPPPPLQASLRLPPKVEAAPADPVLKNTIDDEPAPPAAPPKPTPTPRAAPKAPAKSAVREVQSAQRKLSKQLFYPPEAVARGIEGDVWLILKLGDDGEIVDVGIAQSSGHAILDNAAIRAAYAMGKQTGTSSRELIVPAYFRLLP